MDFIGRIEEVSTKAGKKGEFVKLKVNNQTFNWFTPEDFKKTGAKVGDAVKIDYSESKYTSNVTGQPAVSKNINSLAVTSTGEQIAEDAQTFMPADTVPESKISDDAVVEIIKLEAVVEERAEILTACKAAVDELYKTELKGGKVDLTHLPRVVNALFVDVCKNLYFKRQEVRGY